LNSTGCHCHNNNMQSKVDVEQPAAAWEARWRGITFKVPHKSAGQKTILDDCSGAVLGGQVCGVLGPSGSGKTTLLDALAGRIDGARKGRTLLGDISGCERCAYVSQEEAFVGVLTTRETLHTAAALVGGPARCVLRTRGHAIDATHFQHRCRGEEARRRAARRGRTQ